MGREIVSVSRASSYRAKRVAQPGEPNETPRVHYAARRCGGVADDHRVLGLEHAFSHEPMGCCFCAAAGWIEGRTVAIEYHWAEGRSSRAAEIAAEFVRLKVDVIVTYASSPVLAAKQVTSVIPIVFRGSDRPGWSRSPRSASPFHRRCSPSPTR
jgi:hypothetical protein